MPLPCLPTRPIHLDGNALFDAGRKILDLPIVIKTISPHKPLFYYSASSLLLYSLVLCVGIFLRLFLSEIHISVGNQQRNFQINLRRKKQMPDEDTGCCPSCGKPLVGAVEIVQELRGGIPITVFRETSDRNWIQCDACNTVVCKGCCRNAPSGFCNSCWTRLQQSKIGKSQTKRPNQSTG